MKRTQHVRYYLAGSVSLITFVVYCPSLYNDFVWDDIPYLLDNPFIRSLNTAFFKWAFLGFSLGNWHPYTWISHALDYAVWGLNPLGHHLTNIILHAGNTFLVVLLVIRLMDMLRERRAKDKPSPVLSERAMLITGGFTGILFGLHPLHVESVAWVAERKDLLCALFFLLSITMYARHVGLPDKDTAHNNSLSLFSEKNYLLAFMFFTFALLSKPMAVSFPAVLLILDWYPFKRIQSLKTFWIALTGKLPFIILGLVSSLVSVLAQRSGGAITSMEAVPISTRLLTAVTSLMAYLWKMTLPLKLMPFYPYQKDVSLLSLKCLLAIVLAFGITATCVLLIRKQRLWLSVWGYYIITLIPVIGIVQIGGQSMADRYTYLPSIGPFLVTGLLIAWASENGAILGKGAQVYRLAGFAIVTCVLVSITYLTSKQIGIWKDSIVLWSYVIEQEPRRIPFAYYNRAVALDKTGQFSKAIEDFDKTIALNPFYFKTYFNRGTVFGKMGHLDKAIEDFDKTIALNPSYYLAYYDRGTALGEMGRFSKAIEDFDKTIALNPSYYLAYYNRGTALGELEQLSKAIEDFDKTIALNPSYYPAYYNRGVALDKMGQFDRAIKDFGKTIALDPSYFRAYDSRGGSYSKAGLFDKAIADFNRSIAINPTYPYAYRNRGLTYSLIGQHGRALEDINKAISLNQNSATLYYSRGAFYLRKGDKALAVSDFKKACHLGSEEACGALRRTEKK